MPAVERRRLASRAVTAPLLAAAGRGTAAEVGACRSDLTPIVLYQEALAAAGVGEDVSAAKKRLRALGGEGASLASRLSKASTLRNGVAHIDVGLAAAIRESVSAAAVQQEEID